MFNPDKHTIDGTIEIHTWQYHIAAIGIFITWLINMFMVSNGVLGVCQNFTMCNVNYSPSF